MHICEHLHRAGVRSEAPRRQQRAPRGEGGPRATPRPSPSSLSYHAKQRPRGMAGASRRHLSWPHTTRPHTIMGREYGGGGLLTAPPAPAGAGPGVALKIHHKVTDKPPATAPGRAPPPAGRGTGLFQSMAAGQRKSIRSRGPGGTPQAPHAHGCEDRAGSPPSGIIGHHGPAPGALLGMGE